MSDVRYQWVRFSPDADWPSSDFEDADWVLVEVTSCAEGKEDLALFGVEYTMPASAVDEWGPEVPTFS